MAKLIITTSMVLILACGCGTSKQNSNDIAAADLADAADDPPVDVDTYATPDWPLDIDDDNPDDIVELVCSPTDTSDIHDSWDSEDIPDDIEVDAEIVVPPEPIPPALVEHSSWGGYTSLKLSDGTGFFSTAVADERAWLIDPEGHAFFSLGIQAVGAGSLAAPALGYAPGTLAQMAAHEPAGAPWGEVAAAVNLEHLQSMLQAGFNTVGGWSGTVGGKAPGLIPYSVSLGFAGGVQSTSFAISKVSLGGFPDVFHPDFAAACHEYATNSISPSTAADPWNIGYYSDNELRWWGKDYLVAAGTWTLADDFINEAAGSPGKQAIVDFMIEQYQSIASFNEAYGLDLADFAALADLTSLPFDPDNPVHKSDRAALVELIAEAYFAGIDAALEAVAPNHMNLCIRIASTAPEPVFRMAGKYCDVVSINDYYLRSDPISDMALGGTPEERWAAHAEAIFATGQQRPVLVTEYGLRADDTGLPNTFGAGYVDPVQQDRARFYRDTSNWFMDRKHNGIHFVTGWHWFMYMDEPPTGRFDGEDGNYGIVTIRDEKYQWTISAMASVNKAVDSRLSADIIPSLLDAPEDVTIDSLDNDGVLLTWPTVPNATAYRITALDHPAGIEGRTWSDWTTDQTSLELPLNKFGTGLVWFAVEASNEELLSLGATIVGPVTATPDPVISQDEVLNCESLASVTYDNAVPLPNDSPGQTYVRLVESFSEASEKALAMEFLPSSLGFILLSEIGNPKLTVTIAFPESVPVESGETIYFELLARPVVPADKQVVAASEFLTIEAVDGQGETTATWSLSELAATPGEVTAVALPVDSNLTVQGLQFALYLFTPGLPMEQSHRIVIDNISIN
jgi:hypothetical protein